MQQQPGLYLGHLVRVPVFADLGAALMVLFVLFFWQGWSLDQRLMVLIALFVAIVLHELGHALVARRKGMAGVTIVISALGGYCSYLPGSSGRGQTLISLAGPLMNGVVVLVSWLLMELLAWQVTNIEPGSFMAILAMQLSFIFYINIVLGVFNILPIYPLDGGQAMLHFLARSGNQVLARKATLWSSLLLGGAVLALFLQFGAIFMVLLMAYLMFQAWSHLS
jgi:Zn-dependent protease